MVLSEHGGVEGIFDMLYPEIVFTANGGHDVETDRQVYIEVFDVGIGGHDNMAHFFPIDCILRCKGLRCPVPNGSCASYGAGWCNRVLSDGRQRHLHQPCLMRYVWPCVLCLMEAKVRFCLKKTRIVARLFCSLYDNPRFNIRFACFLCVSTGNSYLL